MGHLLARGYVVSSYPSEWQAGSLRHALGFGSRGGLLPRRLKRRWTKDLYSVGGAPRRWPGAIPGPSALSIDEDLTFEHDQSLVLLRMGVKRGHLASGHPIFDQDERLVSLFSRRLHGPQTPAGKPEALPLSLPSDDRPCSAHRFFLICTGTTCQTRVRFVLTPLGG